MLHNTANLVKLVDVDAERMLRTAEGLARSSVTRMEYVNRLSAEAHSSAEAMEKPCQLEAAPSARPSSRRKKSKKKKEAVASMNVEGDNGGDVGLNQE